MEFSEDVNERNGSNAFWFTVNVVYAALIQSQAAFTWLSSLGSTVVFRAFWSRNRSQLTTDSGVSEGDFKFSSSKRHANIKTLTFWSPRMRSDLSIRLKVIKNFIRLFMESVYYKTLSKTIDKRTLRELVQWLFYYLIIWYSTHNILASIDLVLTSSCEGRYKADFD